MRRQFVSRAGQGRQVTGLRLLVQQRHFAQQQIDQRALEVPSRLVCDVSAMRLFIRSRIENRASMP